MFIEATMKWKTKPKNYSNSS